VDGFVGREAELARLAELGDKVRAGDPQVVSVRGPAGIGKTSVVRRFANGLHDFTVLVASADAGETGLDHGVVGQLVRRVPAELRTPLLTDPVPADASPLAVGAQLLDLLGRLQATGSVAMVVDDAQWADAPSVQALGFVLRRIWADQVLVIVVAREDDPRLARLARSGPTSTTIELSGLRTPEVARLSLVVAGRELPAPAAERLRSYTGGHPLHLRTLLAEVPSDQLAGEHRIAVPRSLVTAVRATTERLPEPTRDLLDGLAVLGTRGPLARLAHVAGVPHPSEALQPALDAGLAQWWPNEPSSPVGIVHELQREAIYSALSPARRSLLHARAAEVVDRSTAWAHRVAAATSADADLAADLEAAATEQADLGQHGVAAEYLLWAADLSPARADQERRLLTSGVQVLFSWDRTRVFELLPRLERCTPSPLRSLCLGFAALFASGEWAVAQRWFTESRANAGPDVPNWVRSTAAAGLAGAYTWSGRDREAMAAVREALAAGDLPVVLRDYTELLAATARSRVDGMAAGLEELDHLPHNPSAVPAEQLDTLACRGAIRTMLGRFTDARRDLTNVVLRTRRGVFLIGGAVPHCYLAAGHYQLGDWDEAAAVMRHATALDEHDEQPQNRVLRRMVAAFVPAGRGDWAAAGEHVRAANRLAQRLGGPQDLRYAALAEATVEQARGDHARVFAVLSRLPGVDAPDDGVHRWWDLWWRPLLVEALLALDRTDAAATQLDRLRVRADGVAYLDSTVARLTAWHRTATGDGDAALADTAAFLRRPRPVAIPLADSLLEHDHARRLLAARRVDEATTLLRSAKARLHLLGATPFELRVDGDLDRCGVPDRTRDVLAGLTDREWEVARLVGRNLTNREIGARLYVTTKTVEYHLGNVYAKLGIGSRRELRVRLESRKT